MLLTRACAGERAQRAWPLWTAGSFTLTAGVRRSAARRAVIAQFTSAAVVWRMLIASAVAAVS
jgi:hypothetical protein